MKTEKNILVAFILNLLFSVFEFFGGLFTGSVAIVSDAVHDLGDAASIGLSYVLERKSRRAPDRTHTYGYARYSVVGGLITTAILLFGSIAVTVNAVGKILHPTPIHYDGMIVFALIGAAVNFAAAFFTREGDSINQRAVNLHMLEDVLGWIVVLIGAVVMRFTDFVLIDPLMSIGVAVFIFIGALGNLKEVLDLFLEKTPHGIDTEEICQHVKEIDGVLGVHHVHVWSMDGQSNYATMHVVTRTPSPALKKAVKDSLAAHGIAHATLELEGEDEECHETHCSVSACASVGHHHHHHHHHHHGHSHKQGGRHRGHEHEHEHEHEHGHEHEHEHRHEHEHKHGHEHGHEKT